MCNINVWLKPTKMGDEIENIINATAHSYATNNDGEGCYIYPADQLIKGMKKINYWRYRKLINDAEIVATHQRLATCGYDEKYTHPFANDRIVLMHNGVFRRVVQPHSDTYEFFIKLSEKLKTMDMKTAIESALNHMRGGSYSIFIWDKIEKAGYYLKNAKTNITVASIEGGGIYITTSRDNLTYANVVVQYTIEDDKLYKIIKQRGGYEVYRVGDIRPPIEDIYEDIGWRPKYKYCDWWHDF